MNALKSSLSTWLLDKPLKSVPLILLAVSACSTVQSTPTPKVDLATLCPKPQPDPAIMTSPTALQAWSSDVTAYFNEVSKLVTTPPSK